MLLSRGRRLAVSPNAPLSRISGRTFDALKRKALKGRAVGQCDDLRHSDLSEGVNICHDLQRMFNPRPQSLVAISISTVVRPKQRDPRCCFAEYNTITMMMPDLPRSSMSIPGKVDFPSTQGMSHRTSLRAVDTAGTTVSVTTGPARGESGRGCSQG